MDYRNSHIDFILDSDDPDVSESDVSETDDDFTQKYIDDDVTNSNIDNNPEKYDKNISLEANNILDYYSNFPDNSTVIKCETCGGVLELTQYYTLWCIGCDKEIVRNDKNNEFNLIKNINDSDKYIYAHFKQSDNEINISILYAIVYDDVSYTKILMNIDDNNKITYYQPSYLETDVEMDSLDVEFSKLRYNRRIENYANFFRFKHFNKENNLNVNNLPNMLFTYI